MDVQMQKQGSEPMNTVKLSDLKAGSYVNYCGEIITKEQAEQIIASGNRPTLFTVSNRVIEAYLFAVSRELEVGKVSDSYYATDTYAMRIVYDQDNETVHKHEQFEYMLQNSSDLADLRECYEQIQEKNEQLAQLVRKQEETIQKLSTEIGFVGLFGGCNGLHMSILLKDTLVQMKETAPFLREEDASL
jgi:hypothetical protein